MEIIKFQYGDKQYFGSVEKRNVIELINFDYSVKKIIKGRIFPLNNVKVLPPIKPSKIIGIALNNKKLVGNEKNYKEPLIFLKSPTSLTFSDKISIPSSKKVWVEVEIGIVISKKGKNIKSSNANEYIFGHLICNDMTMENIESRDHHLARSKSLDNFCPSSSSIFTGINTGNLSMVTMINGQIMQNGNSKDRIFDDSECIELVSKFITLEKGDLILTGTVENAMNCLIKNGDIINMEVENLGDYNFKIN